VFAAAATVFPFAADVFFAFRELDDWPPGLGDRIALGLVMGLVSGLPAWPAGALRLGHEAVARRPRPVPFPAGIVGGDVEPGRRQRANLCAARTPRGGPRSRPGRFSIAAAVVVEVVVRGHPDLGAPAGWTRRRRPRCRGRRVGRRVL
jgi:hypothetical protein